LIAIGILLVEVLVIFLCRIKDSGFGDLSNDGSRKALGGFNRFLRLLCCLLLRRVQIKNSRTILRSVITELRIFGQRIDVVPKNR
jgi:hypothetical protein